MTYKTRNLDYQQDKSFLSDAVRQHLSDVPLSADIIKWNYECNPLKNANGRVLEFIDDASKSSKAGVISIVYRNMNCLHKRYQVALCGNFIVLPDHRSLQPAIKLVKEAVQAVMESCPFIYGFPNDKAVGVLKMAGFKVIGKMVRYVYILRTGKYIYDATKTPYLSYIVGGAFDLIRNSIVHLIDISRIHCLHIEETKKFSVDINDILEKSILSRLIINTHHNEYLNWRYFSRPGKNYMGMVIRDKNTKRPSALAVLEKDINNQVLHIRDIVISDSNSFKALLSAVRVWSYKYNVTSISMSLLCPDSIVDMVRSSGFVRRESTRYVCVKAANKEMAIIVENSESWFLIDGDEDQ